MPSIGGLTVPLVLDTLGFSEGAEQAQSILENLATSVQDVIDLILDIDDAARESFRNLQALADQLQIPTSALLGSKQLTQEMENAEKAASRLGMEWDRFKTTVGAMSVSPNLAALRGMMADVASSVTDGLQGYNDLIMGNKSVGESFGAMAKSAKEFNEAFGVKDLTERQSAMSRFANAMRFAYPAAPLISRFLEYPAERGMKPSPFEPVEEELRREREFQKSMQDRQRDDMRRKRDAEIQNRRASTDVDLEDMVEMAMQCSVGQSEFRRALMTQDRRAVKVMLDS